MDAVLGCCLHKEGDVGVLFRVVNQDEVFSVPGAGVIALDDVGISFRHGVGASCGDDFHDGVRLTVVYLLAKFVEVHECCAD